MQRLAASKKKRADLKIGHYNGEPAGSPLGAFGGDEEVEFVEGAGPVFAE